MMKLENVRNMSAVSNCAQALSSFEGFFSYAYFYFYFYYQDSYGSPTRPETC